MGLLVEPIARHIADGRDGFQSHIADLAIKVEAAINELKVRDWVHNLNALNQMKAALDDHLYAFKSAHQLSLPIGDLDNIIDNVIETAKKRNTLWASSDHGRAFYATLERVLPDWRERRQRLNSLEL